MNNLPPIRYKELGENLEQGMKSLNIRDNIPHIIIGKDKEPTRRGSPYKDWKNYRKDEYVPEDLFQKRMDSVKRWGLLIAILLIASYAAYRIIKTMFLG